MVCGWRPASEKVTENSLSGGRANVQGVWQLWPVEVLASAPAGVDSNWMLTAAGSNFGHQSGLVPPEAQPARARPEARITITRRMSVPSIQRREPLSPASRTTGQVLASV